MKEILIRCYMNNIIRNKKTKYFKQIINGLMVLVVTVISTKVLLFVLDNMSFFSAMYENRYVERAPLKHKVSCWLGNGEALKPFLPMLIRQSYGLNLKNVNTYLVVDSYIERYLKEAPITQEDRFNINEEFSLYGLPAIEADTYAEYFEKAKLQILRDSVIFDTLENELKEFYIKDFRKLYLEHLERGYKDKKSYSFATDILRVAAYQGVGNKNEALLYVDVDVDIDYRKLSDTVKIKKNRIIMQPLFNSYSISKSMLNYKNLIKINNNGVSDKLVINNDLFLGYTKSPALTNIIKYITQWQYLMKNLSVMHCVIYKETEASKELKYAVHPIRLTDITFNNTEQLNTTKVSFISKRDVDRVSEFWKYFMPLGNIPATSITIKNNIEFSKDAGQSDSEKEIHKNVYQNIKKFLDSHFYYAMEQQNLSYLGLVTGGTYAILTIGGTNSAAKSMLLPHTSSLVRAYIVKSFVAAPEELGISYRKDIRSWVKNNSHVHDGALLPIIKNDEQLKSIINAIKVDKGPKNPGKIRVFSDKLYRTLFT